MGLLMPASKSLPLGGRKHFHLRRGNNHSNKLAFCRSESSFEHFLTDENRIMNEHSTLEPNLDDPQIGARTQRLRTGAVEMNAKFPAWLALHDSQCIDTNDWTPDDHHQCS